MRRLFLLIGLIVLALFFSNKAVFAQQGCCSYHGGVSYCASSGRDVCADGSYSPTCTCSPPVTTPPSQNRFPNGTALGTNSWCGAGQLFGSQADANQSLQNFKTQACTTQDALIAKQTQEISNLKLKVWANFILLGLVLLVGYNGIKNEHKWYWVLDVVLAAVVLGGFYFLLPL
jgi:hypothetical protein